VIEDIPWPAHMIRTDVVRESCRLAKDWNDAQPKWEPAPVPTARAPRFKRPATAPLEGGSSHA
jgi:hypothetical protein